MPPDLLAEQHFVRGNDTRGQVIIASDLSERGLQAQHVFSETLDIAALVIGNGEDQRTGQTLR